jgi:hypothetical protein
MFSFCGKFWKPKVNHHEETFIQHHTFYNN